MSDINDIDEQPGGSREGLPASPGDEKWLGGRKWTGIAAVAVLALALLVGGVVVFDTRPPQTSLPAPARAGESPGGSPASSPGGQAQTPEQAIPSAPPAGVTWAVFHGAGVPVSATAGPARVVRSVATGYAHSPSGALLAAVNLPVRLQLAPDAQWKEATLAMAVDTPTREKWLAGRGKYASRDAGPGELAQITGFQVQSYSPAKAEIWITSARSAGQPYASLATLSWQQGDWKLVMNGSFTSSVHAIADLTGFVPWSGVS